MQICLQNVQTQFVKWRWEGCVCVWGGEGWRWEECVCVCGGGVGGEGIGFMWINQAFLLVRLVLCILSLVLICFHFLTGTEFRSGENYQRHHCHEPPLQVCVPWSSSFKMCCAAPPGNIAQTVKNAAVRMFHYFPYFLGCCVLCVTSMFAACLHWEVPQKLNAKCKRLKRKEGKNLLVWEWYMLEDLHSFVRELLFFFGFVLSGSCSVTMCSL